MKISNSTIAMVSNYYQEDKYTEAEELSIWTDTPAQSSTVDTVKLSHQLTSILETRDEKLATLDAEEVITVIIIFISGRRMRSAVIISRVSRKAA